MFDSLLEIVRSYGIVGALFITAPTAISLALYFQWWRNRKSLSYEILASTRLFSVNSNVSHRIKVFLDDKAVKDVQLVFIEIQNDGYLPIEDKDFSTPIFVDFGKDAKIISVDEKPMTPKELEITYVFQDSIAEIEPLLLNRGDSIRLQFLVEKFFVDKFIVSARIKGVPRLLKKDIAQDFRQFLLKKWIQHLDSFFLVFIMNAGVIWGIQFGVLTGIEIWFTVFGAILLSLLILFMIWIEFKTEKLKRLI